MPIWKEHSREIINGLDVVVKDRSDSRDRHGSLEYIIEVIQNGITIHSERHSSSVWLGHCNGYLLKPLIVERALKKTSK